MRKPAAGRRSAAEVWAGLNARQRAFLLAIVDADCPAGDEGWMLFSLDPEPTGPDRACVLDGLRAAGWSTRGTRSTLRGLLERGLINTQYGLERLPDGRLADRVRTIALAFGSEVAGAGRTPRAQPGAGLAPTR
ncbi:hypothetical protein [Kitasatospora sp. NPDC051914]|uniref:hypothetical protein n=1 Tax=Kitasatospora sp. NPDC051914 TaxID=3154945 RepID=UPI003416E93C